MVYHVTGSYNTAVGALALLSGYTGDCLNPPFPDCAGAGVGEWNTALGSATMSNLTTGVENTAAGMKALFNTTEGSRNLALGKQAGYAVTTGSDNLLIGHPGGASDEANTIRIGTHPLDLMAPTDGEQARAFMAGVFGVHVPGEAVCVDSSGQLGQCNAPDPLSARRLAREPDDSGTLSVLLDELQRQVERVGLLEDRLETVERKAPP